MAYTPSNGAPFEILAHIPHKESSGQTLLDATHVIPMFWYTNLGTTSSEITPDFRHGLGEHEFLWLCQWVPWRLLKQGGR